MPVFCSALALKRDCRRFHFQSVADPVRRARSSRPSACTLRAQLLSFLNNGPSCGCFSLGQCLFAQSSQRTGGECLCGHSKKSSRARLLLPVITSCDSSSRRSVQIDQMTQVDARKRRWDSNQTYDSVVQHGLVHAFEHLVRGGEAQVVLHQAFQSRAQHLLLLFH